MTTESKCEPALKGEVVYFYAFDVANEIRLDLVGSRLAGKLIPFTLRPDRTAPRSLPISHPLEFSPASIAGTMAGAAIRLLVRVYEIGVVSITVRREFGVQALVDLMPFHAPVLDDSQLLDAYVRGVCSEVCRDLEGCLLRPGTMSEPEAYTVFALSAFGHERDANRWLSNHRREVAGLLTETAPTRLSESQVDEVIRLRRSFENTDLVVIDWDAALVVDLEGYTEDVLFVLELANLQLEEFQWMDRMLDRYLEKAYADLGRRWVFGIGTVLRFLRRFRIDLARLADEVTHATKFIGDWHLARVYMLARERFHLEQWRTSVEQRLGQLDQLYTLARGELYDRRMLILEVLVAVFFAIDLILLFARR